MATMSEYVELQAENERLRAQLDRARNARLEWAMSCICDCGSCRTLDKQLRAAETKSEPPNDRLERALMHLSLYVAANGDGWVQLTARRYLAGAEAPSREALESSMAVTKEPPHDESQCWEPCGDLGKSEEHARVSVETPEFLRSVGVCPECKTIAGYHQPECTAHKTPERPELQQLARECKELVDYVIDGGCDHSVGLCVCKEIRLRDRLDAIIGDSSATAVETSGSR